MAVTAIWSIKGRFDRVIDYAINPLKTIESEPQAIANFHAIDNVVEYAVDEMKTEECKYVTGLRCDPECAKEQFKETKLNHCKTGGIVAFHAYQSFAEGEVDAATAHDIGVELAKRLWGEYEVIVATHCNTGHYHNHFVVNSVSFVDGHKFNACKESYRIMRKESDRLCKEYGLSVIRDPKNKKMNYAEWRAENEGQPTRRGYIRQAIDVAVLGCENRYEFLDAMDQMGFIVDLKGKHPKIKHVTDERFFRFDSLGEGYSYGEILDKVDANYDPKFVEFPDQESPKQVLEDYPNRKVATFGYTAVYHCYNKALKIVKERPMQNRALYALVRLDLSVAESYSDQIGLLAEHHIENEEELQAYRKEAVTRIEEVTKFRQDMRNALKRAQRAGDTSQISRIQYNIQISSIQLKKLRHEVNACDAISERMDNMRSKLQRIEDNNFRGKENERNEHISRSSRPDRENVT